MPDLKNLGSIFDGSRARFLVFSREILSLKSQSILLKAARRESSFQISRAQLIKQREDKRS